MKESIDGLLAHLEASGTGKQKLAALQSLADRCETFDDFTKLAVSVVPSGTVDKMEAFYADQPKLRVKPAAPAAKVEAKADPKPETKPPETKPETK